MDGATLGEAIDAARRRLYCLAPERFAAARAELVASTDDPELAAGLRSLRRPTLAAWIVNAHADANPDDVQRLIWRTSRAPDTMAPGGGA